MVRLYPSFVFGLCHTDHIVFPNIDSPACVLFYLIVDDGVEIAYVIEYSNGRCGENRNEAGASWAWWVDPFQDLVIAYDVALGTEQATSEHHDSLSVLLQEIMMHDVVGGIEQIDRNPEAPRIVIHDVVVRDDVTIRLTELDAILGCVRLIRS